MRNLKRVLSTALAIAMMMSLVVFSSSAAFTDQDKIVNTDAVNMNVALNIINGRGDGTFDPTGNVTRAEMAKMICILLNGGTEPAVTTKAGAATFTDIRGHWAEGYIESCVALGIVAGMGDGTFAPNGNVTGTQAAKMLLVALGYDAKFEEFNGANWNVKINVAASQKNLYEDVTTSSVNTALSRDNAAQMVWNALEAKEVKYVYSLTTVNGSLQNVQVREDKDDTMLKAKYDTETDVEGILIGYKYDSKTEEYTYTLLTNYADTLDKTGTVKANKTTEFKTKADFTGLFGLNVKVIHKISNNKTTVYGMYAEESVILDTGIVGNLDTSTKSEIKFKDAKYDIDYTAGGTAEATLNALPIYELNNWTASLTAMPTYGDMNGSDAGSVSLKDNKAFEARLIDVDDNGDVDYVVYVPFTVSKISYVGTKTLTGDNGLGSQNLDDIKYYTGIAKDDFVKVTAKVTAVDKKTITLDKVDKVVNGKVTRISGSTYYIDDVAYKIAAGVTPPTVGAKVKDAAVVNGYIFDLDASGIVDVEDFAVVVSTVASANNGMNGDQAKLLFSDGTKKVVDTQNNYTSIPNGTLVTFDTNSDKEYELTTLTAGEKMGFDAVTETGAIAGSSSSSNKVAYLNGWNIADDAVIFVKYQDNGTSYKMITGAQLKNTSKANLDTLFKAFAMKASSSGYNTVNLAYINSTATLSTADTLYGYAIKDYGVIKNADNKNVNEYILWDGNKEVTVVSTVDAKAKKAVVEGDVVAYTLNNDGKADEVFVYATKGSNPASEVVAITAYDGKYIQYQGSANRYEIDKDDTTIIYIDNGDVKGVEGGNISLAQEYNGKFVNNAVVLTNGVDEVDLIVFDVTNDIGGNAITVSASAVNTVAALNDLFADHDKVTVTGNYTLPGAVTVPTGKTLAVNGNLTAGSAITVAGTLTVTGDVTNTAVITVTGTMNVTGDVTNTAAISGAGKLVAATISNGANAQTNTIELTAANAVAQLVAIPTAAGKTVILGAASTGNAATANGWYNGVGASKLGAPATNAPTNDNGVVSVAIDAAVITVGTYKYGTFGYDAATLTAPNVGGWFLQP